MYSFKKIFLLSLPLMYGGIMSTLMTFLDGVFLAWYSKSAFNALILIIPFVSIVGAMGTSLAATSAEKLTSYKSVFDRTIDLVLLLTLTFTIGLIITIIAALTGDSIVQFYTLDKASEEAKFIKEYWFWITPSFIIQIVLIAAIQIIIVFSKARAANLILTIVTVINITLSPVLIFVFGLGVMGCAIATDIAFLIGLLIIAARYRSKLRLDYQLYYRLFKRRTITPILGALKKILINFSTILLSVMVYVLNGILFNKLAFSHSMLAVTVLGVSEQLKGLFIMPSRGILGTYITVFGKVLQKKLHWEYWGVYWKTTLLIGLIYLPGIILFLFFTDQIAQIYDINDLAIIKELDFFMLINSIIMLSIIIPRAAQVAFLSLEKPLLLFFQSLCTVILTYGLAYLFLDYWSVRGIVIGQLFGLLLANVVFYFLFQSLMNKKIKLDKAISFAEASN